MKYKINSYFAVLLITIAGAGASLLIMRVANNNTFTITYAGSQTAHQNANNGY